MLLDKEKLLMLETKANQLRHKTIDTVVDAGSGHLGGALSMIDAATLLYYQVMNINLDDPDWEDRDRFVMSKGHAGIGLITIFADLGWVPEEDLKTFNHTGSKYGIHLDSNVVPGVDASTGSLGHGLSLSLGMALASKQLKKDYYTYCMLGDGECQEGSVWEAAMAISHLYKEKQLKLITMVDRNKAQIDGETEDIMSLEPFQDKWTAFGFHAETIDGHDFETMAKSIDDAKKRTDKPTCIILDTVKGKGV
ncbi:MAG: transketolase, partial [Fastidiosipila sp.]|nr:transketolase [Fastidiosipila sp.]